MAPLRVLIVEDDRSQSEILFYNLEKEGFKVYRAYDGREAIALAKTKKPDIILLDIMLPTVDGLSVCRHLRHAEETRDMAILMLTAKSGELDQVDGFSAGADDYVVKPYSIRVLLERIRALQRRRTAESNRLSDQETIEFHGIRIDLRGHQVFVRDQLQELTRSEFRLLHALMREPGRVIDRSELIRSALGEDTLVLGRTIDVHIRSIRRKLGDLADVIETVRGVGYRFKQ